MKRSFGKFILSGLILMLLAGCAAAPTATALKTTSPTDWAEDTDTTADVPAEDEVGTAVPDAGISPLSSLNALPLEANDDGVLRVLVSGHIYGGHDTDVHPAATLMNSLDSLTSLSPDLFVILGDMVPESTIDQFEDVERDFLNQVKFPVVNAVGNHDLEIDEKRVDAYRDRYGETVFNFRMNGTQIFILDTVEERCQISGRQVQMLEEGIRAALEDDSIDQIMIFMHYALMANHEALYLDEHVVSRPNEWRCYDNTNYPAIRQDLLIPAAEEKPVHVFAGDVGAWNGNLSPFYFHQADTYVYEYATGIGDAEHDSLLLVEISETDVTVIPLSLTGESMLPIEKYTIDYYLEKSN
ncbi:MAG: metallophosphoesterase [Anaerolineaceae bacterium]|nr:metallophosphoesterase [Anaerolineaceae bacterium]